MRPHRALCIAFCLVATWGIPTLAPPLWAATSSEQTGEESYDHVAHQSVLASSQLRPLATADSGLIQHQLAGDPGWMRIASVPLVGAPVHHGVIQQVVAPAHRIRTATTRRAAVVSAYRTLSRVLRFILATWQGKVKAQQLLVERNETVLLCRKPMLGGFANADMGVAGDASRAPTPPAADDGDSPARRGRLWGASGRTRNATTRPAFRQSKQ